MRVTIITQTPPRFNPISSTLLPSNEYTLAVNVLAPFLLTSLLLPSLRAAGNARVVTSSSVSMGASDALSDLQLESSYDGHKAYSLSKLCDAMLSVEMHTRYGEAVSTSSCDTDMRSACVVTYPRLLCRARVRSLGLPSTRWTPRRSAAAGATRKCCGPDGATGEHPRPSPPSRRK